MAWWGLETCWMPSSVQQSMHQVVLAYHAHALGPSTDRPTVMHSTARSAPAVLAFSFIILLSGATSSLVSCADLKQQRIDRETQNCMDSIERTLYSSWDLEDTSSNISQFEGALQTYSKTCKLPNSLVRVWASVKHGLNYHICCFAKTITKLWYFICSRQLQRNKWCFLTGEL